MTSKKRGWIGVDLDGTLAHYDNWVSEKHIGAPVMPMLERVQRWIAEDRYDVKIFTARVGCETQREIEEVTTSINQWCDDNGLPRLEVTCKKDYQMVELWDDRAVQVMPNTGVPIGQSRRGLT